MPRTWAEPALRLEKSEKQGDRLRLSLRVDVENLELVSDYLKQRLAADEFGADADGYLWMYATEAELLERNEELREIIAERDRWKNDPERKYVVTYVTTKEDRKFKATPAMDRHEMLRFLAALDPELPMGDVLVNGDALGLEDLADLLAEAEEFAEYVARVKKG